MSTLESVSFRSKALDQDAVAASNRWLAEQPGFLGRTTARAEDGELIDLVRWESPASAQRAAGAFSKAPENARLMAAVEPSSVTMKHLEVVAERPLVDLHGFAAAALTQAELFFQRSTSALVEEHSGFRPNPAMMSVAEQVAHVALTLDWFVEGVLGQGFDLDFEAGARKVATYTSLAVARERLDRAFANARACFAAASVAELGACLPANPILERKPRFYVIASICEHTAHHRGALSAYARVLGLEPPMPYV